MASSGRSLYQRYLQVISHWPLDPTKQGRDLSVRIRARVGVLFPKGELSQLSSEQLQSVGKELGALERIVSDANRKLYSNAPDTYSGATGLGVEQLHQFNSTISIEERNRIAKMSWINKGKFQLEAFVTEYFTNIEKLAKSISDKLSKK